MILVTFEKSLNPSLVRGTGLIREFVPKSAQASVLQLSNQGSRLLWAYKPFNKLGRSPFGFITPVSFTKRSALQLVKLLLSKKTTQ